MDAAAAGGGWASFLLLSRCGCRRRCRCRPDVSSMASSETTRASLCSSRRRRPAVATVGLASRASVGVAGSPDHGWVVAVAVAVDGARSGWSITSRVIVISSDDMSVGRAGTNAVLAAQGLGARIAPAPAPETQAFVPPSALFGGRGSVRTKFDSSGVT